MTSRGKFHGGAMAPTEFGGFLSLSWPLAVLTFEDTRMTISFRTPWIKKLGSALALGKATTSRSGVSWWSADASEISEITVGRRSLVAKTRLGDARFVLISSKRMNAIESEIRRLGIHEIKARTTVPSMFSMSSGRKVRRNKAKPTDT
jgi:hypothetical protein